MFSPSKRGQFTDQMAYNIERMAKRPHKRMFINEQADTNRIGEPLYRLDQQDLKWKDKRNQFQARQDNYIKQFSPKKRSKSQLNYDNQISDFVSPADRDHLRLKNSVHAFPKKRIVRDRLNESCSNIFGSNSANHNSSANQNLNASVQFWKKPRSSISPMHNRSSSIMIDSFCQDKDRDKSPKDDNRASPVMQVNPNYINRYKNTNVILGFNDSSPQPGEKGIKTFHDQYPHDTNIVHLISKTSTTGFNHNISYQINDRSRENSQTNARLFNLGSEATPSFHKHGIKTFFQAASPDLPGQGLPNPLTGDNMKKEKAIGLRILNSSAKKMNSAFDSIYNSMSEISPEKNIGKKCKFTSSQKKVNPIAQFESQDPNAPPTSARQGKKTFASRQSPSPVKYIIQQTQLQEQNSSTYNTNAIANIMNPITQQPVQQNNTNQQAVNQQQTVPATNNLEAIAQANRQMQNQKVRQHKKLIEAYPKSNQPSQFNYLVFQNSSFYQEKYKEQQGKNHKGSYGQRNKSPNMKDVMYSESSLKGSILQSASNHNINNNNNNMNHHTSSFLNTSTANCEQFNEDANESILLQSTKKKQISQQSQQENISDHSGRVSSKSTTHQQSQQQQSQQQHATSQQQNQQHSSSQMSVSGKPTKKYYPEKIMSSSQQQSAALNLSQVKQAVKMGEISGVKKIYDFESFKNKYR